MSVEQRAAAVIRKYDMLRPGDHIVAGVSGGADSVCLLKLLAEIRDSGGPKRSEEREHGQKPIFQIHAVHVHHGLRQTADRDAGYVQELCVALSIPLETAYVNAKAEAGKRGMSVEEAGRYLRYMAFADACRTWEEEEKKDQEPPADETEKIYGRRNGDGEPRPYGRFLIAVAHHMEDRAETVLFNLCRGSSIRGIAGIRAVSDYAGYGVIRPLIDCSRGEIEEYLKIRRIPWCEDETNRDENITRNFIRLEIFPALTEHVNSQAVSHIARAAGEMEEAEAFLEAETRKAGARVCSADGSYYSIPELEKLAPLLQRRILYEALTKATGHRKDVSAEHIEEIRKLIRAEGTAYISMPYGAQVKKEYDRLYFVPADMPETAGEAERYPYPVDAGRYRTRSFPYVGDSSAIPSESYTKWVDYDKINRHVVFRARQKGDVIILDPEGHEKKLARVMIDRHIPEMLRDRIVLPMSGSHVIWFPGYRIGADCRVDNGTKNILELKLSLPETEEPGRDN